MLGIQERRTGQAGENDQRIAVSFLDLKLQNQSIWTEIMASLSPVLAESQFILGPAVELFENHFAEFLGVRHCVGLNNGTTALHMALLACDIGAGDEVITTPATWISTSWSISYVGARPVFVDIDPVTYTLDPNQVESAITARTRAILPVHLYGQAANLEALKQIADRHHLELIEDAAQAHGAWFRGKRVGTVGRGKNLGAFGEGWALGTNDDRLARRVRCLRDHAQAGRHHHIEIGFNARMEGVQGAVLDAKLPFLDGWNKKRASHARLYNQLLAGLPGLGLPQAPEPEAHVWHLYVVLVRGCDREVVRRRLAAKGIGTAIHYPIPVPFQPAYSQLGYKPGSFSIAEDLMSQCISLPMYPELTEEQVEFVAQALRQVMAEMNG